MVPTVAFSILLCFVQLYFNGWIVPRANTQKILIEQKYLNKGAMGNSIYNLYLRDNPTRIVIMQYYDAPLKTAVNTSIEEFTNSISPRLVNRIEAEKIVWDSISKKWIAHSGIERSYLPNKVLTKRFSTKTLSLNVTHNQIVQLRRSEDEMNFDELKEYIEILRIGGKDIRRQKIDYYGGYALPFAHLIIVLFGVPFASIRKKGGLAIQMSAVLVITFVYLVFTKVSQTIGYSSDLNPILIAWLANIVFLILALFVIYRTRT
jgi:lipopolysaccharide export system permease protein